MKKSEAAEVYWLGFLCGSVVAAVYFVATGTADHLWQQEAVDRGYAEYGSASGEWQWIEPKTKEPHDER